MIKFRIWNKRDKIIIYPQNNEFVIDSNKKLYYVKDGKIQPVDFEYEINFHIGLKDKNGREIYENDIVEWESYVTSVVINGYYEDWTYLKIWHKKIKDDEYTNGEYWIFRDLVKYRFEEGDRYWLEHESFGYEGEDLISPEDTIVIGNIYENPELLCSSAQIADINH
jgi:uncharacterized phage protein (TIGR01671 family)